MFYENYVISRCAGRRVLEYGCGQGSHAFLLAGKGAQVTAIDLSETAIEQARETARLKDLEIDFRVMNAEVLDFEDDTFDIICGTAIIHHLDLRKAFCEVARTLRPTGFAIFMEPLGHNPLINLYRKLSSQLRTEDEHPLRIEDFELAHTFFREVDVHYFHLLSLLAVPFRETRFFQVCLRFSIVWIAFYFTTCLSPESTLGSLWQYSSIPAARNYGLLTEVRGETLWKVRIGTGSVPIRAQKTAR
jgi:SAM-dependent methyltransferase